MTATPIRTIFKRTWELAFAMSLSRLLNTINSFVGILMISRLSTESLAASALITSTQLTLVLIAMSLLFAVGIMTGRSFGAQKYEQVGIILQQGLLLAAVMSIPVMLIMSQIQPLLEFLGQDVTLTGTNKSYFDIYLFSVPALLWMVALQQSLLAIQEQRFVFLMSIFGLIISVGGGYIFIYGWGKIPAMGVPGLGLAYAVQVWLSLIIYAAYSYFSPRLKIYKLLRWHAGNHWDLMKKLLNIGWPIGLQAGSDLLFFSLVTLMIGWLGTTALAAQQISTQFFILLVVPLFAIAQSSGILIGQARGAKNLADIKRYGNMCLYIGVGFSLIVMLLFTLIPHQLINLYQDSANLSADFIKLTSTVLMLTGLRLVLDAAAEIYTGSLRGLYDTKIPMIILVSITWLMGLPLVYLFGFIFHWGLIGITASGIIGMAISTVVLYWRWEYQCKQLAQQEALLTTST